MQKASAIACCHGRYTQLIGLKREKQTARCLHQAFEDGWLPYLQNVHEALWEAGSKEPLGILEMSLKVPSILHKVHSQVMQHAGSPLTNLSRLVNMLKHLQSPFL